MTSQLKVLLSSRRFLPLFGTQFLGAFNDNFFRNALVVLVSYRVISDLGMGIEILVSLLGALFVLPPLIFSATAGQLADKYEKAHLVKIVKSLEIVVGILATIGFALHSTLVLTITLTLMSVQYTFFGPVKYSILPKLLANDELVEGNGLIEASTFIGILLGTITGGAIAIIFQANAVLIGIFITAFALIGFSCSLFVPTTASANSAIKINPNVLKETLAIIRYSTKDRQLWLAIFGISWLFLLGAVLLLQFPVLVANIIHGEGQLVTLFLSTFSIGIAVGALLCNRLLRNKLNNTYVPVGVLATSIFLLDFSFAVHGFITHHPVTNVDISYLLDTVNGWRMIIDLFLLSMFGGIYVVPLYVTLQTYSEKSHVSRVIAGNNVINTLFMLIGIGFTGLLLALHFTLVSVIAILAVISIVVAIYICGLIPDAVVKSFVKWLLRFYYKVEVHGLDNYVAAGKRKLIVANHSSFLDALLLAAFLPEKLTFAIGRENVNALWVKLLLNLVTRFPIDPTNALAAKGIIDLLEQDKPIMMFPEDRITVTGALMKVYEGPGLVADKARAPIVPVRISGAQHSHLSQLKGRVRLKFFPKITLTILPPERFDIPKNIKGRDRREILGKKLYDLMSHMMFESTDYQTTLFQQIIESTHVHGRNKIILEDIERKPISYGRFILGCFVLGKKLASKNNAKDPVGLLLPNASATAVTFFGLHAHGQLPAMLNYTAGSANLLSAIKLAQIKLVVTSHKFIEVAKLSDLIAAIESKVTLIYLEDLRNTINVWDKLYGMLQARFANRSYHQLNPNRDPNSPAVILFTSGSEGIPKGVALSHQNLLANAAQTCSIVDFNSSDIAFNCLPIFHCFGLTGGLILPLAYGLKCFLYPSPLHYRIIPEMVYALNATMMFGTDTFLAGYAEFAHPYDFYSLRYVFAGAEKLKPETRRVWSEKFGVRVLEGYGATETAPIISVNTAMYNRPGTVGRFFPGIQHKLQPVPGISPGGELLVKGPNMMLGYLDKNNPGKILPQTDWYNTGDIVTIDDEDFITIIGRTKRFAKIAGEMVSLTAVEMFVAKYWPEYNHVVVALKNQSGDEELILISTTAIEKDRLTKFAKEHGLARVAIPKIIFTVEEIPLLGTGKVNYPAARELAVSLYENNHG